MNLFMKYQAIAWAVVAVCAVLVIYMFKRGVGDKVVNVIKNKELAKELDNEVTVENVTRTEAQLNADAAKLYQAMKGVGTDEEAIYAVFQTISTRSDVLRLISAFGLRDGMTLGEWISDDCSAGEIAKINQILADKDINYQF